MLETNPISEATKRDYFKRVGDFVNIADEERLDPAHSEDVEYALRLQFEVAELL